MTLRLLHYADLEAAYDVPERVGRLATAVRELRDDRTVVTGGGDDTGPCVLRFEAGEQHAFDFFEAVEPDVETFGNHEFDGTTATARAFARESPQTWLNANVYDGDERFAADATEPWTVVETAAGRVGVVGVTTPSLSDIKPTLELDARDPVDAARRASGAARDAGAEYVVAVSHCGDDEPLARGTDLDAVLGGHDHAPRDEVIAGTRLVRPGVAGHRVVEVRLDADGTETRWHDVTDYDLHPDLTERLHARLADLGLDEVVARVDEPIDRGAEDGGSTAGTFVAEAFRRAGEADVGLVNTLTMRDCGVPLSGDVRRVDLHSLVPFGGDLVTVELTGRDLRAVVQEASAAHLDRDGPAWNGQFAGLDLTWDAGSGEVQSLTVDGRTGSGRRHRHAVADSETYRLTTIEYLVVEDVEFPTLTEDRVVARSAADGGVETGVRNASAGPVGVHEALANHAVERGFPGVEMDWFERVGETRRRRER